MLLLTVSTLIFLTIPLASKVENSYTGVVLEYACLTDVVF